MLDKSGRKIKREKPFHCFPLIIAHHEFPSLAFSFPLRRFSRRLFLMHRFSLFFMLSHSLRYKYIDIFHDTEQIKIKHSEIKLNE